jgi:hypothetical protein
MQIGIPELIVVAAASVVAFFGWLVFRPKER